MSLLTAQLHPGRALGFLILGATLHDVLTRLKSEPQRFPQLEVIYSPEKPVTEPVCVTLPQNGLRLRFDGPEQRLRLIEVVDFTRTHITFKDRDLMKPSPNGTKVSGPSVSGESPMGPTFRHIYHRLLGPTYGGEFLPPPAGSRDDDHGIYVLSYPGVAFNFSLPKSAYSADKDVVTLLSPSSGLGQVATSMAIFSGASWAEARQTLWTQALPSVKQTSVLPRTKDVYPDQVSLVRIHGGGKLDLFRKWTKMAFRIQLGATTPQELVMELGPPNAIYRKNEQKMIIHKMRTTSNGQHGRPSAASGTGTGTGAGAGTATRTGTGTGTFQRPENLTDTDQSSMKTGTDDSDNDEDADDPRADNPSASGECFFNYFYHGFDVLLSPATPPSAAPPGRCVTDEAENPIQSHPSERLVATKLVLHGNVPGSYEFNRHRRCRWDIAYLEEDAQGEGEGEGEGERVEEKDDPQRITSETRFDEIERRMNEKWGSAYSAGHKLERQRGMALNRGWGDSPGSSCEFVGGWEEGGGGGGGGGDTGGRRDVESGDSTTTLFGFPGLVFEVLRNNYVNTVTVF
ncbi:hypothetical protein E4U40_008041 [Claviceps sp. LM458 group G5]|nr:hypothetical protein E4U40_008041 [Claviceps sp. LM458 group G5]